MDMMSDFDYSLDVGEEGYEEDEFGWDNAGPPPGPMFNSRHSNNGFMKAQYSEAFGDYRGGYGPGGGFGPPRSRPYPPGPLRGMLGPPRGRGYGILGPPQRRGPPIHRAAQFLAKCGVSPQYIKSLPRPLLDMILPDYCGLCVQNFDSFITAKIHYNSKNHYKAQKKFMAQHKPAKYQTEIPMKARNLYCELCDVQITSKSHADSHYAGRSHHAIVEKRKVPKNPFLLQQGMENRIEQLIRREKKFLKAPVVETVDETKKAVERNAPPELICEICKTSVTCSEQMTNHLNGKRHLTKEKQHILNMMKGKTVKNNPEEEEEEEEEADDDEVTIVKDNVADVQEGAGENPAEPPTADHVDEWGAGGGAEWDTQNTTE